MSIGPARGELLGWSPPAARATWTAAVVLVLLYALYQIRETLFIFVLAVFFSYMVAPAVGWVERHTRQRASRTGSMALVYLLVMGCVVIATVQVGTQIVTEATKLATQMPELIQDAPQWLDHLPLPATVKPQLEETLRTQAASLSENALPMVRDLGLQAISYAGNVVFVVLIPILSFMLSKDATSFRQAAMHWLGEGPARRMWDGMLTDLNILLANYIRALLLLSLATFTVFAVFLSLVGVPYSFLCAVLAAIMEFIPMVGPLTAAAVVLVVAGFSGYPHMLWLVLFFVLYRLFEDYVLSPLLMSSGVELSPILVIFGVLAGEHLGGVPAMFLSIPLTAAVKIVAVRVRETGGEEPALLHPVLPAPAVEPAAAVPPEPVVAAPIQPVVPIPPPDAPPGDTPPPMSGPDEG